MEGAAGSTAATAAPGRVASGTGNGDAQLLWMHKTVATLGTETPADITGITGGNDHKTVTFAIRPAATGTDDTATLTAVCLPWWDFTATLRTD